MTTPATVPAPVLEDAGPKPLYAYKVLRCNPVADEEVLVSCMADHLPTPLQQTYTPLEWVTAPVGGFLCFDDLDAVRRFFCDQQLPTPPTPYQVWLCEVLEPTDLPPTRLDPSQIYRGSLATQAEASVEWLSAAYVLWSGRETDPRWLPYTWPDGTAAYRKVKLVQQHC